jgi:excisionase family DNA binding protein
MDGRLLTMQEARKALRIGARKLDELVRCGDLEIIRLGARTVRVTELAVRDLLERRTERRVP